MRLSDTTLDRHKPHCHSIHIGKVCCSPCGCNSGGCTLTSSLVKPIRTATFGALSVVHNLLSDLCECVEKGATPVCTIDLGPKVDTVFYFPSIDYVLCLDYIWPWEAMDLCQGKLPYYYKNLELEEQKLKDEKMMLAYGEHSLRSNMAAASDTDVGDVERATRAYQHLRYLFDTSELREEELNKAHAAQNGSNSNSICSSELVGTSSMENSVPLSSVEENGSEPALASTYSERPFLPSMKNAMMVHLPDTYNHTQQPEDHSAQQELYPPASVSAAAAFLNQPPPASTPHQDFNVVEPYNMQNGQSLGSNELGLTALGLPLADAGAMSLLASVAGSTAPMLTQSPKKSKVKKMSPSTLTPGMDGGTGGVKERKRKANFNPGEGSKYLKAGYYCCDQCPYRVRACLRNLRGHLKCHEANGMYKCDFCSFSSNFPRSLKRHEALHGKFDGDGEFESDVLHDGLPASLLQGVTASMVASQPNSAAATMAAATAMGLPEWAMFPGAK